MEAGAPAVGKAGRNSEMKGLEKGERLWCMLTSSKAFCLKVEGKVIEGNTKALCCRDCNYYEICTRHCLNSPEICGYATASKTGRYSTVRAYGNRAKKEKKKEEQKKS